MKSFIQWTKGTPEDSEEIDSALWSELPRKPLPVGGEIIDNVSGWAMDVNIQGISAAGADHIHIVDLNDGSGGVVFSYWFDDIDDIPPDRFHAEVWTLLPLAPDARIGGAINTRQSKVVYAAPAHLAAMTLPIENTVIRPWSEFVPPANPCHGKWVSPASLTEHQRVATSHGWREWTEGLNSSELDQDGFVKPQRPQGRYNVPPGTITYFLNDASLIGVHVAAVHEVQMEEGDIASSVTLDALIPVAGDALSHLWTTLAGSPNEANWPNGAYRCQIDVNTAMLVDGYGFLTRGGSVGHFARVNAGLTADEETWTQTEVAFTGTGIKLATRTLDPSAGAAGDRFECLLAADNSDSMMDGDLNVRVDDSDSFADGPWTGGAAPVSFPPSIPAMRRPLPHVRM